MKSGWSLRSSVCWRGCLPPKAGGWPSGGRSECAISDDDFTISLRLAVKCLRQARVRYAIIGAWALSLWGKPRATADLDFLILVNEQELERVSAFMTRRGMSVDEVWQQWNPLLRGSQLRFQHRGVTIDLLSPRDRHDQEIIRRRRKKRVGREYYWVVSLEDFILQKVKVGRPRDFEDALSAVERFREQLDQKYLRKWAVQLRVAAELSYVMAL
jgi:hypothetical protein